MEKLIGIASGKGGVGKTIVSVNLAAALQRWYGKRVLLADCNLTTSHVGLYLGIYSTPTTFNDALRGHVPIQNVIYDHASGISVMPSSLKLQELKNIKLHNTKARLKKIMNDYDVIILDSAPGFGREAIHTMQACNEALFVTTPIVHSAADLIKCKEIAYKLEKIPLGVVLNMVRKKRYELNQDDIRQLTEMEVLSSIPFDDRIMESIISKTPVVHMKSKVNKNFKRLAGIVMDGHIPEEESFMKRISAIFRR